MSPHPHEVSARRWVIPVIALGGMLGACARHALEQVWPTHDDTFALATFVANASGCLLIGVLMVYVVEVGGAHPLVRPFLGVGVLGGYTTFSTYAVQTTNLVREHQPVLAAAYLIGTLVAAMAAVVTGVYWTRAFVGMRRRLAQRHEEQR